MTPQKPSAVADVTLRQLTDRLHALLTTAP
jgi:hypothetical protein